MSPERYVHTVPISWEQLHRDARELCRRIQEHGPFTGIVAIARGGLVPAAIVARELGIRRVESMCVQSYDWQKQDASRVSILNSLEGDGSGCLIIDDLVDTGRTARAVRALLPKAYFAALYAKPEGRDLADCFISEVSQDTWILLPWDSCLQFVQPLVKNIRDE